MNCAIYARKSNEQNGVADEAKSVTGQIEDAYQNSAAMRRMLSAGVAEVGEEVTLLPIQPGDEVDQVHDEHDVLNDNRRRR